MSVRRVMGRDAFAEADDRGFRSGVGVRGEVVRRRMRGEHAADIEDAAAAVVGEEVLHGGAVREHHRGEIQIEGRAPAVVGEFVQRAVAEAASAAAGDVVEAVERAELAHGHLDGSRRGGGIGGICCEAARRFAEDGERGFEGAVVPSDNDNARAIRDERACR